jgi:hypothetical protein
MRPPLLPTTQGKGADDVLAVPPEAQPVADGARQPTRTVRLLRPMREGTRLCLQEVLQGVREGVVVRAPPEGVGRARALCRVRPRAGGRELKVLRLVQRKAGVRAVTFTA